jgi:hypothetical protein
MNDIKLYIRGHSYENETNLDLNDEFILDILIGDLNYKDKDKDIAFITFSNNVLNPDEVVILINYNKYSKYIEQNKKQLLYEIQCYANNIDARIPKPK